MDFRRCFRVLLIAALLSFLFSPLQASAHGGLPEGPRHTFTQALGPYELAVSIELPEVVPGTVFVDIFPLRDPGVATISLRAAPRGQPFAETPDAQITTLVGPQGAYYSQVFLDQSGDWDLEVRIEGEQGAGVARIPLTVVNASLPPFTVPLVGALSSLMGIMLVSLIVNAHFESRKQRVPRWLDGTLHHLLVACVVSTIIFGLLQWNGQVQRESARSAALVPVVGRPHANLVLSTEPTIPKTGQQLLLTMDLSDGGTGLPVDDLVTHHEALMHLVVLDDRGAFLNHIHPPRVAPGRYAIPITPTQPGRYTLYAEIERQGSGTQVLSQSFLVEGTPTELPQVAPGFGSRQIDGLTIDVAASQPVPIAGRQTTLMFTFSENGKPITDLQPWLGMAGHLFARHVERALFAHVHAAERMAPTDPTVTGVVYGPRVRFVYTFPVPGTYQVWGQFRYQGKIITIPLTVEVSQ